MVAPTSHLQRRRSIYGFTLVELLVVLGIIVVLISVLLPTINRVRRQAGILQCGANLRQIGIAWNNYLAESKGRFPPGYRSDFKSLNREWFYGGKEPCGYETYNPGFGGVTERLLNPYLGGKLKSDDRAKVFRCPFDRPIGKRQGDTTSLTRGQDIFDYMGNTYMLNSNMVSYQRPWTIVPPGTPPPPIRVTMVRFSPSRVVLAGDCTWYYVLNKTGFNVDLHGTAPRCNLLYLDGHVKDTTLKVTDDDDQPDYTFSIEPEPEYPKR